jgi:glucosyl-dolichyl phosphate glucuronosyltransferase
METAALRATVLICTYNRAPLLAETLDSLRLQRATRPWDVIVVDNNSTDDTRAVVAERTAGYPVPLSYVFEPRQGKSSALNTGLACTSSDIVAFTDDDVRVGPGWLEAACSTLARDSAVEYVGGPVQPLWGGTPPPWFDRVRHDLWGTLALLDYGPDTFIFEERRKVPLGVNMAVRRRLFDRIGGFNAAFGRTGYALLGQEQAEFLTRSRASGAIGRYVPSMQLEHYVPEARLTKGYFRRWWFWKGVSRSRLDALHQLTETGLDLRSVPHVAKVPRFVWGMLPRAAWRWIQARIERDDCAAVLEEMRLYYSAGYIRARLSRTAPPAITSPPQASPQLPSMSG